MIDTYFLHLIVDYTNRKVQCMPYPPSASEMFLNLLLLSIKMENIKELITQAVEAATGEEITLEIPPKEDMGDFALPCFILAKKLKKSPQTIAQELAESISVPGVQTKVLGPYLNFFVNSETIIDSTLKQIHNDKSTYGTQQKSREVMLIESPGPNTNKPLHLGHLRNMLLGMSLATLHRMQGKQVHVVNVVNDRGVHICKSMLAYQKFGNNTTPEKAERKPDHFVGDYYVQYTNALKEEPELEEAVQDMLVAWENHDAEIVKLWKQMNTWALTGFSATYAKLNFTIDKEYLESETYMHGKEIILDGVQQGIFTKDEKGAIVANLEDKGLGKKVLLRANGTSVYITQDIYMAKLRYEDFHFDEMVYVVGNEQEYHFKVLFEVFKMLDWPFAGKCHHFSYGMVELPDGKMKSREGNVIDTDTLIDQMKELAYEEVAKRYDDLAAAEIFRRSETIALAAIRFFFLKFDPVRNFVFNPKESLSFEGETGPYVQYAYARICSIFRKHAEEGGMYDGLFNVQLLDTDIDKQLVKKLSAYPELLREAARQFKPSLICHYLIDLAATFNSYYRDNPILKAAPEVRNARLAVCDATRIILKNGLAVLGIDVLEQM